MFSGNGGLFKVPLDSGLILNHALLRPLIKIGNPESFN